MMKSFLTLCTILLCTFFAQAQNYYVDKNNPNAADVSNNDGSEAKPWKTIQYGVNQLTPGDILNIKAATYYEKVDIDVSGTPGNIITIKKFNNDVVVISGENSNNNGSLIWTDNAYLKIEGLHLTKNEKNYSAGLTLQGTAHHIDVVNNKVSEINFSSDPNAAVSDNTNSVPISALGDAAASGGVPDSVHHINFIGNEVFNNRTGFSENLTIGGNVSHFVMADNYIHDNKNIGIDATGHYGESPVAAYDQARYGVIRNNIIHDCHSSYSPAAGIYIDGGANIVVENNLCYNNGYGGEIGCEKTGETKNVTFRNNVFHHNESAGMHIGGYDVGVGKEGIVVGAKVYNNTLYQNDSENNFHGELILTRSKDCSIFNNIFYVNNQDVLLYAYRTQTNLNFDYNLIYSVKKTVNTIETTTDGENNGGNAYEGLVAFYAATGYGVHDLYEDPLFANEGANDFHIATNSPSVNKGDPNHTPDSEEMDLDGAARMVGAATDIGVDELAGPLPVEYLNPLQARLATNGIVLSWATTIETKADKFIIQRLTQNNTWVDIQVVQSGKYAYQVLDTHPQSDLNIYRLKQVDLDGQFTLSNMVSLVWESQKPVLLFPNPTRGRVHFSDSQPHGIKVTNMLGQVVFLSENVESIPVLKPGLYLVQIFSKGKLEKPITLIVE